MGPEARARRSRRPRIGVVLISILGVLLVAFLAFGVVWEEDEIDIGYGPTAQRNHFLAAELFLEARGIDTETVRGLDLLDELPPTGDLIIMSSSRRSLSERRRERLIEWIDAGGALIVLADEAQGGEGGAGLDPLLDAYGIQLIELEALDEIEALEAEGSEDAESGDDPPEAQEATAGDEARDGAGRSSSDESPGEPEVSEATGPSEPEDQKARAEDFLDELGRRIAGELAECDAPESERAFVYHGDELLSVHLDAPRFLRLLDSDGEVVEDPGRYGFVVTGERGPQILALHLEEGFVAATTSMHIWHNRSIHCYDHAYVLYLLSLDVRKVWLLHDPDVPSLGELLFTHLPLSTMVMLLGIVLYGFSRSLRYGRAQPEGEGERRELLEHLEASAGFLFRRGGLDETLEALRRDTQERIARHDGIRHARSHEERMQALARITGVPRSAIDDALVEPMPTTRKGLVHVTHTLQTIRRNL